MSNLRILLADDHEVVRKWLSSRMQSHGWEICGEVSDGRQAVEKTLQLKPDLVIIEIGMPNLNGLDATRQILHSNTQQKILILTITDTDQVVRDVLQAGARGFVLKTDAARDLVAAVEAVQQHRTFFTSRVGEMVLDGYLKGGTTRAEPTLPSLTPREREIVQLLAEGK